MKKFTLNIQTDVETVGLNFKFVEQRLRGSKETSCVIEVYEDSDIIVSDSWYFDNWEKVKKEYPTLLDLLKEAGKTEYWSAKWRENERMLYVASLEGHEGLYEDKNVVYFDMREKNKSNKKTVQKK